MTVAQNDRLAGPYLGNGATTAFVYDFKINANTEVRVILRDSDGTEATQSLTTHYTVTGAGDDGGGTIVFVTAPSVGQRVIIEGVIPKTQTVNYLLNDRFPYASHQDGIDKLARIQQELQRDVDQRLEYPYGDTATTLLPPQDERAGKLFGWDDDGNPIALATDLSNLEALDELGPAIEEVLAIGDELSSLVGVTPYNTLADLMAVNGSTFTNGDVVTTRGHTSINDGCGGRFVIVSALPKLSNGTTNLPVDNTGCVNALAGSKWAINLDYYAKKIVHPRMFGAPGDGSNQDTQLDNLWDCYAGLAILNHGSSPYSVLFGSRLPEQPEIIIDPGVYARATYSAREFNYAGGFSIRASQGAVLTKQGFRFKGLNGFVSGLCPIGENVANSYGIHCGDADFDTNDGTLYWQFENCVPEKFAVNWLITADVESSFNQCRANGALLINRAILRAQDSHWVGYRGTRSGGKWGTLIQPWGTGAFSINVGGCHFTDDAERKAEGRNAFVTGGDGITSLTTADDPYIWVPNGYASVKIAATWECYYTDCDWANDSEESNNPTRRNLVVTSMVQSPANASFTRVTTSTPHFLQHLMDIGHAFYEFTSCGDFSGASGSGSGITIRTIISTTVFDCDINPAGKASFSGTGNLALPEYNLAIYGQSAGWAAENLNSHKFVGGHSNWTLWGRSRNVQWLGFRHKQNLVADGPGYILGGIVEECFTGDLAAPSSFDNNIRIVGAGSIDIARHGSKDFNLTDSVTRVSNDFGQSMERPLSASGVAADGGAAKVVRFAAKYDRGELGITTALTGSLTGAYFNEAGFNFVTAGTAGLPIIGAQTKATGSKTYIKLEDRHAQNINLKDYGAVGIGATQPLSGRYSTLDAAREDYSFAVSLNQEIDACALHAAYLAQTGTGLDGTPVYSERPIYAPPGIYWTPQVAISSIADNGGGTIIVTTGSAHSVFAGGWVAIRTYGTNDYIGCYQVLTAPTDTTFTVTAAFTSTATGFCNPALAQSGTGQSLIGEGKRLSRFSGLTYIAYGRDVGIRDVGLIGAGLAGIFAMRSARRYLKASRVYVQDKIYGNYGLAGGEDNFTDCEFRNNTWNDYYPLSPSNVSDREFHGCIFHNALALNIFGPTDEIHYYGGQCGNSASTNMLILERGGAAASLDVYSDMTMTLAATAAFSTITAVADNGGGTIRVTVGAAHNYRIGEEITQFGTTDYNGAKVVTSIPSDTSYVVAGVFGVTRTGSVRRKHDRCWLITGIANAGGGLIEVTTDGDHDLRGGLTTVTISGTTNYNATYNIVARTASNKFTVSATYVSSQTGTVAMRGWDLVIDADDDPNDVNDCRFGAMGNINYAKIHGGLNITFYGRIKQQLHMSAPFNRLVRYGDWRGRESSTFTDVRPDGPYSNYGWTAFASRDDGTTNDNDNYASIVRPDSGSSVGTDGFPVLHEVQVGALGVSLLAAGVVRERIDNTNGINWVPKASTTPASNGELTLEFTSNTTVTIKGKGSDGTVRSGTITLS